LFILQACSIIFPHKSYNATAANDARTLHPYLKYSSDEPDCRWRGTAFGIRSNPVIPALAGRERQLVVEWFKRRGRGDVAFPEERFGGHRNLVNYYPNWFIPTVAAFKAMASCAGFAIVDEGPVEADDLSLLRPN
jgi:hypothetical protein